MKRNYPIAAISLLIIFSSCLEDEPDLIVQTDIGTGAVILRYLESTGDFVNTPELPGTILAEEIYNNLDDYLILDIRDIKHFSDGHIPGAVSVNHSELPEIIESNRNNYEKIVIVSYTGQAACYYTSLSRYLNFQNVYSLKFGMASWHSDFANYWLSVIINEEELDLESYERWPKEEYEHMPDVGLANTSDVNEIQSRIKKLFNFTFVDTLTTGNSREDDSVPSILAADIRNWNPESFTICYSMRHIYWSKKYSMEGIVVPEGVRQDHLINSLLYISFSEYYLQSQKFLQTLPNDEIIYVYSSNGLESACAVAYLRILGYSAKSLLFGASHFNYYSMTFVPDSDQYLFSGSDIKNYEYTVD